MITGILTCTPRMASLGLGSKELKVMGAAATLRIGRLAALSRRKSGSECSPDKCKCTPRSFLSAPFQL